MKLNPRRILGVTLALLIGGGVWLTFSLTTDAVQAWQARGWWTTMLVASFAIGVVTRSPLAGAILGITQPIWLAVQDAVDPRVLEDLPGISTGWGFLLAGLFSLIAFVGAILRFTFDQRGTKK